MINPSSNFLSSSLDIRMQNSKTPDLTNEKTTDNTTQKDIQDDQTQSANANQKDLDEKKLQNDDVRKKIEEAANALFDSFNTDLAFKYYQKSNEWYAVIEDKLTQKVVKELPPKAILEMHAQLKSMIGFFIDKKI